MELTKEVLLQELEVAQKRYEDALANTNGYLGAIQAYRYLITLLDKEENAEPKTD